MEDSLRLAALARLPRSTVAQITTHVIFVDKVDDANIVFDCSIFVVTDWCVKGKTQYVALTDSAFFYTIEYRDRTSTVVER